MRQRYLIGIMVLLLGVALALPAWAATGSTLTLRTMLVKKYATGFARVDQARVKVATDGQEAYFIDVVNGDLTVTVPRVDRTKIQIQSVDGVSLEGADFAIIFYTPENFIFYEDSEGHAPEEYPVTLFLNDDGTYYPQRRCRLLGLFKPQGNLHAPIMGLFDGDINVKPLYPTVWGREQIANGRSLEYYCFWDYGEPDSQPVSLRITWRYPDGSTRTWTLNNPDNLMTADGLQYDVFNGERDHVVGNVPLALGQIFTKSFAASLQAGDYLISYALVDPDGNVSTPQQHWLTVLAPEKWD